MATGFALVVLCGVCAASVAARGRLPFNSDQSVVCLMALDILREGAQPVFYYGSEYAGALEARVVATAFAFFPASVSTYRFTLWVLLAFTVLLVWAYTRHALGERPGALAGLYLALGPSFLFYKGLTSDGAYLSLLLVGALGVGMLLAGFAGRQGERGWWRPGALGLVMGIGWWIHLPSVFLLVVGCVSVVIRWQRDRPDVRSVVFLLAGILVGSAPWWWRNIETGGASLRLSELAAAVPGTIPSRVVSLLNQGWPGILGARSAWSPVATFPGAVGASLSLFLLLNAFAVWSAVREGPEQRHTYLLLVAVLWSTSLLTLFLARTDFRDPRYLLPAYLAIAPLVGAMLDRFWSQRVLCGTILLVILSLNLGSQICAPSLEGREMTAEPQDPRLMVQRLLTRNVRFVYADYWLAYRLTFVSGGEILATPLGRGTAGLVRHEGHHLRVESATNPGFLLRGPEGISFRSFLEETGSSFAAESIDGWTLFTRVDAAARARVRTCRCLPDAIPEGKVLLAREARRSLAWGAIEGPAVMPPDHQRIYWVVLENGSTRAMPTDVCVSYHWIGVNGRTVLFDGERTPLLPRPLGRQVVRLPVRVITNVPPGLYDLVVDLVDERKWFEWEGLPPPRFRVSIASEGAGP